MPAGSVDDLRRAQRILVYGVTGAGKSTAATMLGHRLGLPVHLVDDEIGWLPASEGPWRSRPGADACAHWKRQPPVPPS